MHSFCIKQPVSACSSQTENKVMTHNFCIKQPVSAWSPEKTCKYKFEISSLPLQTLVSKAKRNKLIFAPTLEWIRPSHSPPGPATAASTRMWDWRWPGSRSSRWTASQAAAPVKQMSEQTNSSLGYTTRRDGYTTRRDGYRTRRDGYRTRRDGYTTRRDGYRTRRDGYRTRPVCDCRSKVMCTYTTRRDGYRTRPVCDCRSKVMCTYTSRLLCGNRSRCVWLQIKSNVYLRIKTFVW